MSYFGAGGADPSAHIGAAIEHTPFHAQMQTAKATGASIPEMPIADPAHLADLLWTMHSTKGQPETTYLDGLFGD